MTESPLTAKRALDLLLVCLASPVLAPVALMVGLVVRSRLGAPVLFVQERAGQDGRPFRLYKFRSMLTAGPGLQSDEERLTPFGRALRATSLDELPSFVNVLRGDLSLVGPRPLPMAYIPRYGSKYARRLSVPPGVSGWAQVHGRNSLGWRERFELDLWYVDHRSALLDLRVLLATVTQVVRRADVSASDHATMTEFRGFE